MKTWPDKDPDELLDYAVDWSARLAQPNGTMDRIDTSLWIVPDGLIEDRDEISDTMATVWLSGGDLGASYTVTNRITTAAGRIMDQSVRLRIRTK